MSDPRLMPGFDQGFDFGFDAGDSSGFIRALEKVEAEIETLRQLHVADHGDAECVTTREIAYGEVRRIVANMRYGGTSEGEATEDV